MQQALTAAKQAPKGGAARTGRPGRLVQEAFLDRAPMGRILSELHINPTLCRLVNDAAEVRLHLSFYTLP